MRMCAVISRSYAVVCCYWKLSEETVLLWKKTGKDAGILLTSDSMGSQGIQDKLVKQHIVLRLASYYFTCVTRAINPEHFG